MLKKALGKKNKVLNNFMGDFDKDGVKNILDCKRFDKRFHGGELFVGELAKHNIIVGTKTHRQYKQVRKFYEKNPELLQQSKGVLFSVAPYTDKDKQDTGGHASYYRATGHSRKGLREKYENPKLEGDMIYVNPDTLKNKKQDQNIILRHELQHRKDFLQNPKEFRKFENEKTKKDTIIDNEVERKRQELIIQYNGYKNIPQSVKDKYIKIYNDKYRNVYMEDELEKRAFKFEKQTSERKQQVPEQQRLKAYRQTFK